MNAALGDCYPIVYHSAYFAGYCAEFIGRFAVLIGVGIDRNYLARRIFTFKACTQGKLFGFGIAHLAQLSGHKRGKDIV